MPINSIANVDISLSEPPATRPGFGIPIVFTTVTSPQAAAFGSDLTVAVTKSTWQAILTNLGFSTSSDAWLAMSAMFSQDEEPEFAILARRATPVAQVVSVTVDAADDGTYTITLDGDDASFSATSNTAEQIRDGLLAALALLPNAAAYGFASVSTDELTVTAANPGLGFTLSVDAPNDNLDAVETTPNTGMATDIVAVRAERDDWYGICEAGHAATDVIATARAVEPLDKIFVGVYTGADALTTATTDVGTLLQTEQLIRTCLLYHDNPDEFPDAALLARMLPTDPGSQTWAFKTLRGVPGVAIDSAQEANLFNKNYTWLELFASLGNISVTRNGITCGGQWLDVIRGRDWLKANMQIDLFEVFRNTPKVDYSDGGAELLAGAIRTRLEDAADAGLVDRSTITISVPAALSQSSANRGDRFFPGITWSCRVLGAIHSVDVDGSLYP